MAHARALLPLDIHDPNFARDMRLWALQTQSEIHDLVIASKNTIAATRVMIAEADRMLAGR